jgi:hypothetical protein
MWSSFEGFFGDFGSTVEIASLNTKMQKIVQSGHTDFASIVVLRIVRTLHLKKNAKIDFQLAFKYGSQLLSCIRSKCLNAANSCI